MESFELFYLGKMRTTGQETAFQIAEDLPEKLRRGGRGRGECQHACDFGKEGMHTIKHVFFSEGFY